MILWGAAQAEATTLPYKSIDNLVQESDGVVSGTVAKVEAKNFNGDIHTYIVLNDVTSIAGNYREKELTLIQDGGFADGQGLYITGTPNFQPGEKVVAFVKGNGVQKVPFVGWEQGVFKVARNQQTGSEEMLDSLGNRVFSVTARGNVEKEQAFKGEAEIFVSQEQSEVLSKENIGVGGHDDHGQPSAPRAEQPKRSTLRMEQFVREVKSRAKSFAPSRAIRSAKLGDRLRNSAQDGVMAGYQRGSSNVDTKPALPKVTEPAEVQDK